MNALADRDVCAALVLSLAHFLWQGMLIAGLASVVARRLGTSHGRYHVLVAAFGLMAISPLFTLVIQAVSTGMSAPLPVVGGTIPAVNRPAAESPPQAAIQSAQVERVPVETVPVAMRKPPVRPVESPAPEPHSGWQRFAPLLMNVYLVGVTAMLLRLAIGLWGGTRLRRRSTPVEDVALLQALRRQANSLGMQFVPILAYCERVAVPTVIGILRPTILLPLTLTSGLAPEQLEAVLAHELAHLRRYDHLVNLLQRIVESLLFFHPAVWWLSSLIRVEREHCCDDLVVACGAIPLDYAKSLLRVAELSRLSKRNRSVSAVSLLATGQPSKLRQRIARLLGEVTDNHVRFQHHWPAVVLGLICLSVAWTTTRVGWSVSAVQVNVASLPAGKPVVYVTSEELPKGAIQRLGSGRYRVPFLRGAIDYSADGRFILAQPDQSMIVVKPEQRLTALDRETGRAVMDPRFELGEGFVQGMALSEDAGLIAVVMRDLPFNREEPNDRVVVIDTESNRRQVLPWERRPGDVRALCISRDKKTLAAGTEGDGLTLWNLETGEQIEKNSWPETRLTSVAFSPDGSTLAVIGQKKSLLWKWQTDEVPRELTPRELAPKAGDQPLVVMFSPDGKWFVVGCNAVNNVRVFDATTGTLAWTTDSQGNRDSTTDLAIDDDSHLLAVPKWHRNAVELWDLNTRKIVHTFKCPWPRSVAFSRDGKWVVAGGENSVHEWNLATHEPRTVGSESHSTTINKIRFAPDGRSLLTASGEGTIWQWDLATGKPNLKLDHETGRWVRGLAVSPDGRIIVSSCMDDSVAVWERSTGKELLTLAGHGKIGGCRPVQFAPDGQRFTTWGDDMRLCWWNTSDGKLLSTVSTQPPDTPKAGESIDGGPEEFPTGVFSSDASTLLMEYLGKLYEIDTATGQQRRQIRTDSGVSYFALSPDGKWLATVERPADSPVDGRPNTPMILRNRDTLEIKHQFKIPTQFVEGIEFSPDSQHLAFAPARQPTTIVNVQSGLIAAQIPNDSSCTSLRFSPNGKFLATSHVDTTVVLWDWERFRTNVNVGVVDDPAPNTAVVATERRATDKNTSKPEPQSQYQTATYLQGKISAKIPDAAWGKPNKGLRLAMVIREESNTDWNDLPAATRVPASLTLRQGDQIHSQLIVENVSDKPINLTGYTYTEVDRSLEVFDREQKALSTNSTHISIPAIPTSWKLLPGERYLLQMPPITFLDEKSEHRGIGYYVRTPPGEYTVRCGYSFGQRGKDDPRPAPDPSEWTGILQAGDIKVAVEEPLTKEERREKNLQAAVKRLKDELKLIPRIRRGQDALDRIEQWKPAWGETRDGLQLGLARLGETTKFRPGERVPLELYFRNVGKQTAKVQFTSEFYSDVPTVRDSDGKDVKVAAIHLLGARARFTETLKPGEAVVWPHWGLGIGADRPAGYSSIWHPYVANPLTGTYTVSQDLDSRIEVEGSSQTGGGLKSGAVKFEIVAGPVAAAAPAAVASNNSVKAEDGTTRAAASAWDKVFRHAKPSIVTISTESVDETTGHKIRGIAMGLIVDARGYILSINSIFKKADPGETRVTLESGVTYPAKLMAVDITRGLALLQITAKEALTQSPLGKSTGLKEGDPILAVTPIFEAKSMNVKGMTTAKGSIGGLHRELDLETPEEYKNLIQTEVVVHPGSGGGPLLNATGEVVGIIVVIRVNGLGTAFAKEIDDVRPFLEKAIPPLR